MAEVIETAVGEIVVRDGTAAGIRSAKTNFDQLYNVVRYNWWGIQNLAHAFQAVGGTIAAGLGEAVKASVSFEQGMTQVGRTANLSGKELDQMGKSLREMALQKPISVDSLTKIAEDAGALGITGVENITRFTGVIADLVATTNLTEDSAVQLARLGGVLGIQGEQWHQLGSAILFAGVNSAATEKDIVNMAVRLSGAAANAHLTAAETVALAATVTSLGSSAQTGATSVQRAISQISKAAATGKPDLETFAHVAGYEGPKAAQQFGEAFNKDAGVAIAQFITGLGKMRGNTIATNAVLLDLGFNSQRGAQTLLQLAAGTQQTVNPMLDLNKSMRMVTEAHARDTELTKQANQVYGSTANQLKITRNALHDVAIGFGDVLLPALNMILQPIADIIWGFDQLPAGMKTAITIIAALVAGLTLAIGAALIMSQRIMLMVGSVKEFIVAMRGVNATVLQTVTALRMTSEAEGEYANVSSFAAGKVSAAKRAQAVAIYQAWNAAIREDIQRTTSIRLAEIYAVREGQLALAKSEAMRASFLEAEAETSLAEAQALAEKGMLDEAAAAQENAIAKGRAAAAAEANAAMARDQAAAQLAEAAAAREAGAANLAMAEDAIASEVAMEGTSGAAYGLGVALDAATGPFAILFLAITGVTAALAIFGNKHRDAAKNARELQEADMQLVSAIKATATATGGAVTQFYHDNAAFNALTGALVQYGYTWEQVLGVISSASGQAGLDKMLGDLNSRISQGDENAASAKKSLISLVEQHNAAVVAATQQAEMEKKTGKATKDMGDASSKAADDLSKLKQAHDAINNAILDLPEAMFAVKDAEFAVKDAQEALSEAMAAGAAHALALRKAEDDLASAQIDARAAKEEVQKAEENLAHAREDAAFAYADAQDKVKDDEDRLIDTHQKIADLEQKIADLRAGPSAEELRDATNKLADANIRLLNSQKKVQDSQYMLNYLMAEGASNRDITDAQDNLAAAQQDVADQTANVSDAQKALYDLQNPDNSKALADAERDLAAAERELAAEQRQLKKDQEALNDARKDRNGDKAYQDALDKLHAAQIRLREANMRTAESEAALHKVQRESPADEVARKQLALEEAMYGLAKAQVRVMKDTALMHGEQFGAGREARALADALGGMADKADGPVRKKLLSMVAALRGATSDINDASSAANDFGGGAGGGPSAGTKIPGKILTLPDAGETGKSWKDSLIGWFKDHWREIAVGILAVLAFVFGPGEIGLLAGAIGLAAAEVAHIFIGYWDHGGKDLAKGIWHGLSKAWDAVAGFFTKDVPKYFMKAVHAIGDFFKDHGKQIAVGLIAGLVAAFLIVTLGVPGLVIGLGLALIAGIVKVVSAHWTDITDFFTKTIPNFLTDHWQVIIEALTGPFGAAIVWVHDHWGAITDKFQTTIDWLKKHWPLLLAILTGPIGLTIKYVHDHWDGIKDKVNSLRTWIHDHWKDILHWLTDPFGSAISFVRNHWDDLIGFFRNLPDRLQAVGRRLWSFLPNGLKSVIATVLGVWNGVWEWLSHKGFTMDIPDWIPGVPNEWKMDFGFLRGMEIPIPKLALGGLAMNPTLAMVGDNAAGEAILPLDRLTDMFKPIDALAMEMRSMAEALDALLSIQQAGGHAIGGDTFNFHEVMADPVDIAREVVWTKKTRLR